MARELQCKGKVSGDGEKEASKQGRTAAGPGEREHRGGFWGRVLLIAGLAATPAAMGAGCGNASPPAVEDADADTHQDVEEADSSEEDSAAPDDGGSTEVEDGAEEDGGVEAEAEDGATETDAEEVDGDVGDAADTLDCTSAGTHTEADGPVPGPGRICNENGLEGSTQDIQIVWEITEWAGPDCTESETRRIFSYDIIIDPPIAEANLGCVGSDMLGMPGGDEVAVSVSPSSVVTAVSMGDETLAMFALHNWGATEYKSRLGAIVATDLVSIATLDSAGTPLPSGPVRVFTNGYAEIPSVPGMPPRGYLAEEVDEIGGTVHLTYIATPVITRDGDSVVPIPGGDYTMRINMGADGWAGISFTLLDK